MCKSILLTLKKPLDVSIMDSNDQYSASSSSDMATQFGEQASLEYSSGNDSCILHETPTSVLKLLLSNYQVGYYYY